MARRKVVVEPVDAVNAPPAKTQGPESTPAQVVVFWKVHPGVVTLPDGTQVNFKGNRFITADQNLIHQIAAVAEHYRILVANGEKIQP